MISVPVIFVFIDFCRSWSLVNDAFIDDNFLRWFSNQYHGVDQKFLKNN